MSEPLDFSEAHRAIWAAIDDLAARHGLSTSGLAILAGMDATCLNKSKRVSADGRLRWPSTETLARLFAATGDTFDVAAALSWRRA